MFLSFARYKTSLGVRSITRPIHIYLTLSEVYSKMCLVFIMRLVIEKRTHLDLKIVVAVFTFYIFDALKIAFQNKNPHGTSIKMKLIKAILLRY